MPRALILTLAAFLLTAACSGSRPGGSGLVIHDLPTAARQACVDPASVLRAGDWELIAGRLGDELIRCENRRELAVQAYDGVRGAVR